jgi:radical SAM superfamily enzyme YgiQ (UPF0313 family)
MKTEPIPGTINGVKKKKVLLGLLPYWTPLIPPQGIVALKVFLEKRGYRVKTVDANVERRFREIYQRYFDTLKRVVPESNWGNFYNIGHDVLRNHMMAHFNHMNPGKAGGNEKEYYELVELLVYHTYYQRLDEQQVFELDTIVGEFYVELETYMLGLLEREKPDVLGLTAHLGTLGASMFSFKLAKERYPGIMTVVGGSIFSGELPTASPDFDFFLERTPYIDKVVVGEGEKLFLKLLEGELPGTQRVFTLKDIRGQRLDIGAIDLPDLSDIDLLKYPYNAAFGSKSCPYQCRFCSVAGFFGEYREKSVKQIVDELDELHKRYGFQMFFMTDSLVNPFITDLSGELIKREMSMYMDAYLRVSGEACDPEITLSWRQGGLYRVRMGIETGSPRLLKLMGKKITIDQSRAALRGLASAGIKTTAYFVIGFPGETEEDFQQTLDFIGEMKNDIWEMECNPFYYYYAGQPEADKWAGSRRLLYPGYTREMLISQTWILDCDPSREERFKRMFRLVEHCNKLGIPNPYTTEEIYKADVRWKNLHENAVPLLVEFNKNTYITENRKVKRFIKAQNKPAFDGDFNF